MLFNHHKTEGWYNSFQHLITSIEYKYRYLIIFKNVFLYFHLQEHKIRVVFINYG